MEYDDSIRTCFGDISYQSITVWITENGTVESLKSVRIDKNEASVAGSVDSWIVGCKVPGNIGSILSCSSL